MSAILVILLVVTLIAIDSFKLYLKRRRGEVPAVEPVATFSSIQFPRGLFLADNHSWARLTELGELKVGMDELLTQAMGNVDEVDVMPVGTRLNKGDTMAVITRLGHKFQVTSPVDGTVVAANDNAEHNPHTVTNDPYGRGWLATVWPVEHNEALRDMKVGDRTLYYHSNEGKEVVGVAKITKTAYQDPTTDDDRWLVVDVEPLKELSEAVTLADIKADAALQNIPLVTHSRLSVMPLEKAAFDRILALGKTKLR